MRRTIKNIKRRFLPMVSNDIGIDLGTANTLVYLRGKGIVLNEPSVVALNQKTGQIVDIGVGAKEMIGRTPSHILAIKPLVDGVISDYEVTEEMLAYLISKVESHVSKKLIGPRVVVGVPSGITNVERRAVRDAARSAGAREVFIVEEPMASAIGIRLPIYEPIGSMIVDMGGGTSDIAIISLGGLVTSRNLNIAGDKFNKDIVSYVRDEFKILIGEKTAERVKLTTTSIIPLSTPLETTIKGRDLVTGLPREVIITDADVREALSHSIDTLVEAIRGVMESAPPEILGDVMQRGMFLVGGASLLSGLDTFLSEWLKIPVFRSDDPLTAVARGTGVILENLEEYEDVLIYDDDALPIQK